MPRGKKDVSPIRQSQPVQPRKAQSQDEWAGFVPCDLDVLDRDAFDSWFGGDSTKVQRSIEDTLGTGLKMSLTFDLTNSCYVASFSGRPDVEGEYAFVAVLTGRSSTLAEALAVLVYKHEEMLHWDWWQALNAPRVNRRAFG